MTPQDSRQEENKITQVDQEQIALVHAGQRKVNLIWEYTQALIAISVVICNMIIAVHIGMSSNATPPPFPPMLSNSLFLVIGFYFSRTNHSSIGGVGPRPNDPYVGR